LGPENQVYGHGRFLNDYGFKCSYCPKITLCHNNSKEGKKQAMFKHAYAAITANFQIEPVIADYFTKYPSNEYTDYQIVFKTLDEHAEDQFTYIIVFGWNSGPKENRVSFSDFLKSHCVCNDLAVAMNPNSNILPRIGDGHTFGQLKKA
jgi:hypothetical protein